LLVHTVDRVLFSLRQSGQIEMDGGHHDEVVRYCASCLASAGMGAQLVDTLSKALVACELVEELYATDDDLKTLITEVMEI
jgi:hypothetical protein